MLGSGGQGTWDVEFGVRSRSYVYWGLGVVVKHPDRAVQSQKTKEFRGWEESGALRD